MQRAKISVVALLVILTSVISSPIHAQDSNDLPSVGLLFWYGNDAFLGEMADLGYVNGVNVNIMEISYEGVPEEQQEESYNQQLQAMIDAHVDVFVVNTDSDALKLQPLVGDTPIVFARSDDPVASGAVQDLINPGGTITGIVTNRAYERRLQILTEILPSTDKVYYLYAPSAAEAETILDRVEAVADELNVEIIPASITDVSSGMAALENTPEGVDWLFIMPYVPYLDPQFVASLLSVSQERHIGVSYLLPSINRGYLMGYGPDIASSDKQSAQIVDRILRGASPADLPVQTAENHLLINLDTAENLGIEIPVGVLRQADVIIYPGYFDNPE